MKNKLNKVTKNIKYFCDQYILLRPDVKYSEDKYLIVLKDIKNELLFPIIFNDENERKEFFNKWINYLSYRNEENKQEWINFFKSWLNGLSYKKLSELNKSLNQLILKLKLVKNIYNEYGLIKKNKITNDFSYNEINNNIEIKKITPHLTNDINKYKTTLIYKEVPDIYENVDLNKKETKFIEFIRKNNFILEVDFENDRKLWLFFEDGKLVKHFLMHNFKTNDYKYEFQIEEKILNWINDTFNKEIKTLVRMLY